MLNKIKWMLGALMLFVSSTLMAQRPEVEMADVMRSNGKIYVVVVIVSIVFVVISAYLISIDRKLRKLEKDAEK